MIVLWYTLFLLPETTSNQYICFKRWVCLIAVYHTFYECSRCLQLRFLTASFRNVTLDVDKLWFRDLKLSLLSCLSLSVWEVTAWQTVCNETSELCHSGVGETQAHGHVQTVRPEKSQPRSSAVAGPPPLPPALAFSPAWSYPGSRAKGHVSTFRKGGCSGNRV